MRGLIVDYGGVLTSNVFDAFRDFCREEGLEPETVRQLFRDDPRALQLVRSLEVGEIEEEEFSSGFGGLLGIRDSNGLVDRIFGRIEPDTAMIAAVKRARAAGVRTGLLSNSMGTGRYDREAFPELFDGVVISGEVGLHKPQPEIFELATERVGLPAEECVFVDDLKENCDGAEAIGMTAILHRGADTTIPELERLLEVKLG
ncbi:MAG TPA: HAD family phosphatase [Thermoleophilaceae bacterium]|nr:HAD family phosphatase [Thermoleophilaceae bacterium]